MNLNLPWGDRRPRFSSSAPVIARTVVFEPLFRRNSNLLYVDPRASAAAGDIRNFHPAALAGRLETLLEFARTAQPTHALVAFTAEGARCLSDRDRDDLWNACPVPVFEQVITADGRLVAWECEAHDGLHLAADAIAPPCCAVTTAVCACGTASPRIANPPLAPLFTVREETQRLLLPAAINPASRSLAA